MLCFSSRWRLALCVGGALAASAGAYMLLSRLRSGGKTGKASRRRASSRRARLRQAEEAQRRDSTASRGAPEGKAAGGDDGGDPGEQQTTRRRYDMLWSRKQHHIELEKGGFDVNISSVGPNGWCALDFALGAEGEPHDEMAVKMVLAMIGVDVNMMQWHGPTALFNICMSGRSRSVKLLLADSRLDPNIADTSSGSTPLHAAAGNGHACCLELLLADPRVGVNQADLNGDTPLHIAANQGTFTASNFSLRTIPQQHAAATMGKARCVELLLSDRRVEVNLTDSEGNTPLNMAAGHGMNRCVELFLADSRVDVSRPSARGQTPLLSACMQLMQSMDQIGAAGGNDPTRTLVIMLKSRRIPRHNVEETITFMGDSMPTRRQIDAAEAGGEPLDAQQKTCRIVLPVLLAHLQGDFRWCAHCYLLTPDVDLNRCGGCNQVGYCEEAPPGQTKPCHKAHWKAGHKQECARFQAEAKAKAEAEATSGGGGGGGGSSGGRGGGGGRRKTRGKKPGKSTTVRQ